MEQTMRCNNLKCRKELNDHAVVTTCCHIFCIECSNQLQLQVAGQRDGRRPVCPACEGQLLNPDDAVVTNLNPTEDYKTSVLSGLSPNIIMECAGRALNFWSYQTTQEIIYQQYLSKSLTDKYAALNAQLDKIIHDANSEIASMNTRLTNMQLDQDSLRRKNEELTNALRDKTRKHMQVQELFDKLKRRTMLGQVQNAAFDAVDHTIQASVAANRQDDRLDSHNQRPPPPPPPLFSAPVLSSMQQPASIANPGNLLGHGNERNAWAGFNSQGSTQNQPVQTPSTHRQRLPTGNMPTPANNYQPSGIARTPMQQHHRVLPRHPLLPLHGNLPSATGFTGYGMSTGLKASNPNGAGSSGMARPVVRSRVAQRSSSAFAGQAPTFGPTTTNMFANGGYYG